MIIRILLGLFLGAFGGLISSNLFVDVFYSYHEDLYGFQNTLVKSIGIYFGMVIGLLICIIIELNERKKA